MNIRFFALSVFAISLMLITFVPNLFAGDTTVPQLPCYVTRYVPKCGAMNFCGVGQGQTCGDGTCISCPHDVSSGTIATAVSAGTGQSGTRTGSPTVCSIRLYICIADEGSFCGWTCEPAPSSPVLCSMNHVFAFGDPCPGPVVIDMD